MNSWHDCLGQNMTVQSNYQASNVHCPVGGNRCSEGLLLVKKVFRLQYFVNADGKETYNNCPKIYYFSLGLHLFTWIQVHYKLNCSLCLYDVETWEYEIVFLRSVLVSCVGSSLFSQDLYSLNSKLRDLLPKYKCFPDVWIASCTMTVFICIMKCVVSNVFSFSDMYVNYFEG